MIVAKKWILAGNFSDNTLTFGSIEGGDYRLSGYISVNDSANSGHVHMAFSWTDTERNYGAVSDNLAYSPGGSLQMSMFIHSAPGENITMQINGDTPPAGSTVNFFAVIEEMSAPAIPRT